MKGIEKITQRISQDTQTEIQARMDQAQAQAAEILAAYEAQARREHAEILDKGTRDLAQRQARLASLAEMEKGKGILAAKQQVIEEAFQKALEDLLALPREESIRLLARLAAEASETGQEEILLAPQQRKTMGKAVVDQANAQKPGSRMTLGPALPEIRGGLILRQGQVDLNATFPMLLRQNRAQWSGPVADILFPPDPA